MTTPLASYKITIFTCGEELDVFAWTIRESGLRINRCLTGFPLAWGQGERNKQSTANKSKIVSV